VSLVRAVYPGYNDTNVRPLHIAQQRWRLQSEEEVVGATN